MIKKKSPSAFQNDDGTSYRITIKGYIGEHWTDWLGGLEINHDTDGNSYLTGIVPDQAALHGILAQIRDLGLTLISITPLDIKDEVFDEHNTCFKTDQTKQSEGKIS